MGYKISSPMGERVGNYVLSVGRVEGHNLSCMMEEWVGHNVLYLIREFVSHNVPCLLGEWMGHKAACPMGGWVGFITFDVSECFQCCCHTEPTTDGSPRVD